MKKIVDILKSQKDDKYKEFMSNLTPDLDKKCFIGVRTPELRKLARQMIKDGDDKKFLKELPHKYFEENQLHAFIISETKDFDKCMAQVEEFLPYVNNWATCDQMSPKVFKKQSDMLLPYLDTWMFSGETYKVRFAIGMYMQHFLGDKFDLIYMLRIADIKSDEYYVNMEIAWYMATALYKQWDAAIKVLEEKLMDKWVHNKTIQKARESYRITDERKEYLKSLKQ